MQRKVFRSVCEAAAAAAAVGRRAFVCGRGGKTGGCGRACVGVGGAVILPGACSYYVRVR